MKSKLNTRLPFPAGTPYQAAIIIVDTTMV